MPEYWIVDLTQGALEIYQGARPGGYEKKRVVDKDRSVNFPLGGSPFRPGDYLNRLK